MPRTGRSVLGSAASKGRITGGAKSQEGLVMASNKTPTGNTAPLICFIPGMKEHIQYIQLITQRIKKKKKTSYNVNTCLQTHCSRLHGPTKWFTY